MSKVLISAGANIDAQGSDGRTALFDACKSNDRAVIAALIGLGELTLVYVVID